MIYFRKALRLGRSDAPGRDSLSYSLDTISRIIRIGTKFGIYRKDNYEVCLEGYHICLER